MSFPPSQTLIGPILALAGLALAAPCTLLGRHFSRSLFLAQMLYVFSFIFNTSTTASFSSNLNYSWLSFMPQFTSNYCSSGDFSCNYGYLVSPGICWFGGAALLFLIIKIVSCKKRDCKFLSIYNLYKGLYFWFMPPLVYFSTLTIISSLQKSSSDKNFYSAIIVVGLIALVMIVELIAYKVAQREQQNNWRKWIEFFGKVNIATAMALLAIYVQISSASTAKYLLNVPLALYALIFLWKYKFSLKVIERIVVGVQDAVIIAVYNIFVANYSYITSYSLDFFALAIVILLQIITLIPKLIQFFKNSDEENDPSVNPENDQSIAKLKRNNSFVESQLFKNQYSNQIIQNPSNVSSPKRGGQSPPRRR